MIGTRKGPEIAVHAIQEFDFDDFFFCRDEIAERDFEILRAKRGGIRQQLISRAGGEHNEVGNMFAASGGERDAGADFFAVSFGLGFDASDAGVDRVATGGCGALEQQAVEDRAGINYQRARHLKTRAMAAAGNQLGGADFFFGLRTAEKERVALDGFVREAAAAGLFPGEMLVEERDVEACAGEFFSAEGAGRPAANNGNLLHSVVTRISERCGSGPEGKYSINGRGFGEAGLGVCVEQRVEQGDSSENGGSRGCDQGIACIGKGGRNTRLRKCAFVPIRNAGNFGRFGG